MPDIYYLDEPRVQQRMQMVHEGRVQEVVETYSSPTQSEADGSSPLYNFFDSHRGSDEENLGEYSRTIKSTPIGQFIIFHGILDTNDDIRRIRDIDYDTRNSVEGSKYITIKGKIESPPWTRLYDLAERMGFDMSDMSGIQPDNSDLPEKSEKKILNEMEDAARYYQIPMTGECNGDFVFKLRDENLQDIAREFPDSFKTYTILAKTEYVFNEGEERHYLDLLDEVPATKDRSERTEKRIRRKEMARHLDPLYEDGVSDDDLHIFHPDIIITPIAIYG